METLLTTIVLSKEDGTEKQREVLLNCNHIISIEPLFIGSREVEHRSVITLVNNVTITVAEHFDALVEVLHEKQGA